MVPDRPSARKKIGIFPALLLSILLLTLSTLTGPVRIANAHVGKEGGRWLLSTDVAGDLSLAPDSSLPQWKDARMLTVDSLDMELMKVMTVHNDTYVLFLIQRSVKTSITDAGALIAFEGAGAKGSDVVWAWVGGESVSPLDLGVRASALLVGNEISITFGRELNSTDSAFAMTVGKQYVDLVKLTSWANGTDPASVDLEKLEHMNMELLPNLDVYPKAPIAYSAILLLAAVGFVWIEFRRYS